MQMMNHTDTNLWYVQVVTAFVMFFAGSVHLYVMLTHPGSIDPYLSADRVVSGNMWPLYLILLFCVELHATIGIYRLCMKWGWFQKKGIKESRQSRKTLKLVKNRLTIFFLSVGVLALLVFIVIGITHRDQAGTPYESRSAVTARDGALVDAPAEAGQESEAVSEEPAREAEGAVVVETSEPTEAAAAPAHDTEAPEPVQEEEAHAAEPAHDNPQHAETE
jgi:fumarate reductase subunit C